MSITLFLAPGEALSSYTPTALAPHAEAICLQLAHALAHMHALGLLHDDVKPANVVFAAAPAPVATLVDLGACIADGEFTPSGTPWYAAPEFVMKVKGPATDVWALGVSMAWVLGAFPLPETAKAGQEWILPHVWEDEAEMGKMREWIAEVEAARGSLTGKLGLLVADMLEPHYSKRIGLPQAIQRLNQDK